MGFCGVAVGVAHDGFGGHGGSTARCRGSCGVHSEHRLEYCDVVLALWMEHGGVMREVRVEGGGDHEDQVESRRKDRGQGPKVIAGGSAQSPWLRSRNTTRISGGACMLLSEGDVVASRQKLQVEMEGPMLKRKFETKTNLEMIRGEIERRYGNKEGFRSNQKQ